MRSGEIVQMWWSSAILGLTLANPLFDRSQLSDQFWAEGATFGDFNRDGHMDVAAGPFWWQGPALKKRHAIHPATASFVAARADGTTQTIAGFEGGLGSKNSYSDNFFAFTRDFNRDGWPDILVIGEPGHEASWFENPRAADRLWTRHRILEDVGNESPTFADLTGDGEPEIVCVSKGAYGYAGPDKDDPSRPWTFHAVSPPGYHKWTHGLGVGDVDGDGRADLLEKDGWWQQPPSLAEDRLWTKHPVDFTSPDPTPKVKPGGAQMLVYDVDGDGRNDVITSLEAHGYGLAWYRNVLRQGAPSFERHLIAPEVRFSQAHALALADIDGDGLADLITGKRFWAHGKSGDPEPTAPPVLYWFRLTRAADGSVRFVPKLIDDDSGVGTQLAVGDLNRDRRPDLLVANKHGIFVFRQRTAPARR